jgi:hypothetical protein
VNVARLIDFSQDLTPGARCVIEPASNLLSSFRPPSYKDWSDRNMERESELKLVAARMVRSAEHGCAAKSADEGG